MRDAFARSVLWSFPIAAASSGRYLVDWTELLVRDADDIAGRLQPGAYRFEANRSSVHVPALQGFPKNTEMEAELTFARVPAGGGAPGTGPRAAGATARPSPIRGPARSSRGTSRSARSASGRTT